jgi:hypothetical protein
MATIRIDNLSVAPLVLGDLVLSPGGNEVDSEFLEALLKSPGHRKSLDLWQQTRKITVHTPEASKALEGTPLVQPPDSLAGYGEPAALAFVEVETDQRTLRQWLRGEDRPAVVKAINGALKAKK